MLIAQGGGTGLTGNLLDDWVTAVTQGEYTKWEDVPVGTIQKTGILDGWAKEDLAAGVILSRFDFTTKAELDYSNAVYVMGKDAIWEHYEDGK